MKVLQQRFKKEKSTKRNYKIESNGHSAVQKHNNLNEKCIKGTQQQILDRKIINKLEDRM